MNLELYFLRTGLRGEECGRGPRDHRGDGDQKIHVCGEYTDRSYVAWLLGHRVWAVGS